MTDQPKPQRDPMALEQAALEQIERNLQDVTGLLQSQRKILRQRGINDPMPALDGLRKTRRQLETFNKIMIDAQTELRLLRNVTHTTALINSTQGTNEVLNQVIDTVVALTGAERGYIVLRNKTTRELEFMIARGMDQSDLTGKMVISRTIVNQVADSGEPVLTDNASQESQYQDQPSIIGFSLRSILAVPLTVRDEVIGVVYCDNSIQSGLFKDVHKNLLSAFAAQAAVAIENARLFESSRASLMQVTDLRDRMRNLFTSLASGIITVDQDAVVLVCNPAAEAMIGRTGCVGQSLGDILPPLGYEFDNALNSCLVGGGARNLTVKPNVAGLDLNPRTWKLIISALRDDDGTTLGAAIVLDDLTEQLWRQQQFESARLYLPLALVDTFGSPEGANLEGQERTITAFFADVRGFTAFSEKLSPEELMQIINTYLSLASDAINLLEGIVDKYMGDAVTGLFNTQLNPQGDHAARAVQAALQLVMDLRAQHEVLPEDQRLYFGIGIHTGPAVLGNVGGSTRQEFSALGEATDVCKYLQEQAGPGEIVISGETYALVKDSFECEVLTEIVRPKAGYGHMTMYRVLRRRRDATAHSPFIDQELLDLLGNDNA